MSRQSFHLFLPANACDVTALFQNELLTICNMRVAKDCVNIVSGANAERLSSRFCTKCLVIWINGVLVPYIQGKQRNRKPTYDVFERT